MSGNHVEPDGAERNRASSGARVGAGAEVITEAVLRAQPGCRTWALIDDLRVTALYAECGGQVVCLLSYDVCEITRVEAAALRRAVGEAMGLPPDDVHVYCTHTHSSSSGKGHDLGILEDRSIAAARHARDVASEVRQVRLLRVDTGTRYNISRRTRGGALGVFCLMQSKGCTDDARAVDGTQWVRDKMRSYGATAEEVEAIEGPYLADRPNDPLLDLILFPAGGGGYAGGLVRFTAHAVVCSAGYWRRNLGRDYPGEVCDRLADRFGCPILFVQGPCGDHRPRHRDVGLNERDRIAHGLADALTQRMDDAETLPFDRLVSRTKRVDCAVRPELPRTVAEAEDKAKELRERLDALPHDPTHLAQRKALGEQVAFYDNAVNVIQGFPYLEPSEAETKRARLEVSRVSFGDVHLLSFPGELFSTATAGLDRAAGGRTVVCSFADGVIGYLMPPDDFREGGYEWTYAPFTPESIADLRAAAAALLE